MLHRWAALARHERELLIAATWWVIVARIAVRTPGASFTDKQRVLDRLARGLPRLQPCTLAAARWATTAAARRIRGTVCLPWALALRGVLLQAGIESQLHIGVAPVGGRTIRAHAWVECAGETMSWNEPVDDYRVLHRGVP